MSQRNQLRQSGQEYIDKGYALIDTSSRTRHEEEKNVVALAANNPHLRYAILAESAKKKALCKQLREKYLDKHVHIILQALQISCLLEPHLDNIPGVFICADGFNPKVLEQYLRVVMKGRYNPDKIKVLTSLKPMFGKHNLADVYASKVREKNAEPNLKLDETHLKKAKIV